MTRVVVGGRAAGLGHDLIEQEFVVVAIDHQHDRPLIDRISALLRYSRFPVFAEERLEVRDLPLEGVRGGAFQRHLMPDHAGRGADRFNRQPGRFGISEIGQDNDAGRMLDETIRHFLQGEADVFQTDFLGDNVERHGRKTVVHGAHHAREHGAVADAGIEHAHGRRTRVNIAEFEPDPVGDFPFLRAGVHEQQIFLPVVEEAEIALRIVTRLPRGDRRRQRRDDRQRCRRVGVEQQAAARRYAIGIARHEGTDAVEGVGGDAAAIAQAAGKLAVIDRAAAESGFRQAAAAAKFADLLEDLLVHGGVSRYAALMTAVPDSEPSPALIVNRKNELGKMGGMGGQIMNLR